VGDFGLYTDLKQFQQIVNTEILY